MNKNDVFNKLRDDFRDNNYGDDPWSLLYGELGELNCLDSDYIAHTKNQNDLDSIATMSFDNCCSWLTWALRGERFNEGLFDSQLKNGNILALLDRACDSLVGKEE